MAIDMPVMPVMPGNRYPLTVCLKPSFAEYIYLFIYSFVKIVPNACISSVVLCYSHCVCLK